MRIQLSDSDPCLFTPQKIAAWRAAQPKEKLAQMQRVYDARRRDYATRPIVGVDGEGVTCSNGDHLYTLLAASDGRSIKSDSGLTTEECLEFLLTYSGKMVVSFAFSYDTNLIIRQLSLSTLMRLHSKGHAVWRGSKGIYRISYTPRKSFTVSLLVERTTSEADKIKAMASGTPRPSKYKTLRSTTVWDTFGFFQCSFVKALKEWKIGTAEELAFLIEMKEKRADFSDEDPDKIERYNQLECTLLVNLIRSLRDTLTAAGIKLIRWDGAGAIAAALLKMHNVKAHIERGDEPKEVLNAYFGGRIQVLQLGEIAGPVYNYDINSAYPWVAARLPSLHGTWQYVDYYTTSDWALWHCKWSLSEVRREGIFPSGQPKSRTAKDGAPILTPFPFRDKQRNIHYPLQGEGWYWAPLVALARKHWDVDIQGGWVFTPSDTSAKPFGFIQQAYDQRVHFKRAADPRHIVLKLGLNSLYGKTAQGVGWRGGIPPFRSYVWAGLITATAQAALLGAALTKPHAIIAFATDGIYSTERLPVDIGTRMGEWEETVYDKMIIFQPGLYVTYRGELPAQRTRGYHPSELEWDAMLSMWRTAGPFGSYEFTVNRFLTLGVAIQTHRLRQWGTWVDSPRELHLRPATGFPGENITRDSIRWLPDLRVEGSTISEPYTPKRSQYDKEQDVRRSEELEQPEPLV